MPALEFPGDFPYWPQDSQFRPLIPAAYTDPRTGQRLDALALLDSGADVSMVPRRALTELAIESEGLTVVQTFGTAGSVEAYEVALNIEVLGVQFPARVLVPTTGDFGYYVLGREPLFRHIHFAFEEYEDPRLNRVLWKLPQP